jgi:hypothetical protein
MDAIMGVHTGHESHMFDANCWRCVEEKIIRGSSYLSALFIDEYQEINV